MGYGFYLYGILPSEPDTLDLLGLDAQPVQVQVVDGFTFLYSQAQQERYLASRRNLLGHEKVLEAAMQMGYPYLLPLQFGSTVANWQAVAEQLTIPYGDKLDELFEKLEGRREVGVKVFWEEKAELDLILAENEDLRARRDRLSGTTLSMEQTIAIGQDIERHLAHHRQNIIAQFQATLNPLAVEIVERDALTDNMIYNAAYLIPWDDEPHFATQVEFLDKLFDSRLRIRYNNFTAPFNFAVFKTS